MVGHATATRAFSMRGSKRSRAYKFRKVRVPLAMTVLDVLSVSQQVWLSKWEVICKSFDMRLMEINQTAACGM